VVSQMTDVRIRLDIAHHHEPWRTGSGRQDHTILPYAVTPVVCAMVLLTVARPARPFAPM
ncbi:hypothetical protein ACFQZO_37255, partial [Bradyrhizobium sp. GCM10027634]|uniref:hypothetical protein n=1 Tax=unclassified Bradyrhizobium TaxID=2631580 RepID=UPI00263A8BDF